MNPGATQVRGALARAFTANEIVWRVTSISPDNSACEFSPIVRLSAYHRRLTNVLGRWTYSLRILSDTSRDRRMTAECILSLPGVGRFRGRGKMPVDARAAPERAKAKAFQSACIKAGVGKKIQPIWIAINIRGEPKRLSATPPDHKYQGIDGDIGSTSRLPTTNPSTQLSSWAKDRLAI